MPRHGENIFKRRDGRWEARYVKEVALDGSKRYGSVYAHTYREVKEKQRERITNPSENSRAVAVTIGDVMREWLRTNQALLKISSLQKYRIIIEKHIEPQLGKMPLKLITAQIIETFADNLKKGNLTCESVNQVLTVLSMAFEYAKENYNAVLPDIHLLKTNKKSIRVFSAKEQQILVRYLLQNDDIFSFGVLLTLYTGMRVGEVCALKWEDFSENTVHICGTMERLKDDLGKTAIMILTPKTASSDRIIPLPSELISIVDRYRKPSGFVLTRPNGKFTEPRLLQNRFAKIAAECGLTNAHFHTLRHTFATRCIELGVDVKTLSEILGHSDVKITLNRYVHPSLELKRNSMDRLTLKI